MAATPSYTASPPRAARSRRSRASTARSATMSVSPDGKRIAFVGTLHGKPIRSYSQPDLFVTDAAPGGTPKNLTADYDFDIVGGIGGDQSAPRGRTASRSSGRADGASLIVVVGRTRQRQPEARARSRTGKIEPVTEGAQDVAAYSAIARRNDDRGDALDADQHRRHRDHRSRARRHAARRSRTSTTSCSRTSSRASPKRSGTRASTARRSRAGF